MSSCIRNTAAISMRPLAAASCAAALVSACGGAGSSLGISAPDIPLASALSAYLQSAHQFNLAGSLDGTDYTLSYRYTPSASTFHGAPAIAVLETVILNANGAVARQRTTQSYFSLDPFVSYGSFDQTDGSMSALNQMGTIPDTAKVGQSGQIGTWVRFSDSNMAQIVGTTTVTWSLEADTATTALFCLNAMSYGDKTGAGSDCYRADTGGVTGLVVKIGMNGKTLVLE
jgi:hypothetical protein